MGKKSYILLIALLLAALTLAACGGGAAPASEAAVTAEATEAASDAGATDAAAAEATESQVQPEAVSSGSETSGAGDASGANSAGDAASATDVGSGSDGAQSSGGSDGAGGTTAPNSDSGAPVPGEDATNSESGTGTDESSTLPYMAVSDAECTEVQGQLQDALGVEVTRATGVASFSDLGGGTGESCQLTMAGTGVQFATMSDAATRIMQVLTGNGWTVDAQYAADGPTGTIGGLRRDNQLAAYNVEWAPAAGVTCPADQPISACAETLTPEQMDYTITVDLAQQ